MTVINLHKEAAVQSAETVVQFLRDYANKLETGEIRPAHKAVLIMYEDRPEQFRVATAYCNAATVERAGIISLSLHDTLRQEE